jgi:hypothetical protein
VTRTAAVIGVASAAFLAAGCADRDGIAAPTAPTAPTASATASSTGGEDSVDVGETVRLTGAVVADGGAFVFDVAPDGGGETISVISAEDLLVDEGDRVTAEGRIVIFDATVVERKLGVDFDDGWVRRNTGRRVLLATSVDRAAGPTIRAGRPVG